jgi:hypothetical protein
LPDPTSRPNKLRCGDSLHVILPFPFKNQVQNYSIGVHFAISPNFEFRVVGLCYPVYKLPLHGALPARTRISTKYALLSPRGMYVEAHVTVKFMSSELLATIVFGKIGTAAHGVTAAWGTRADGVRST